MVPAALNISIALKKIQLRDHGVCDDERSGQAILYEIVWKFLAGARTKPNGGGKVVLVYFIEGHMVIQFLITMFIV